MALDRFTAFERTALNKLAGLLFLVLLSHVDTFGQNRKYLVLLRDKTNSPYSVNQPDKYLSQRSILRRQKQNIPILERDLPVNPAYVSQLQQAGAKVWFTSRWLNAVLVETNDATITAIQQLPFVKGLEFGRSLANARLIATDSGMPSASAANGLSKFGDVQPLNYGSSQPQITQIGADKMHQQGFRGEGMLIGVLDAGFQNADKVSFLKPLFDEKRVLATYDFVKKESSVYEDDSHGLSCLSAIAATADNQLYGTAYKASFILLRTEDAATERQIEEANWLFGAEYADSAGVDVISSSLGYSIFKDTPVANYSYQNMDGKTALCSRAAQIATETGMVVVVAAGNEGISDWRYITAPSDAVSVLAIGAVSTAGQKASFSSFGPSADGRVKPDLVARGLGTTIVYSTGSIASGDGTSFATPLVAGLAAGLWQAYPRLTASQITDALRKSGSQYTTPDNQLGYGIPNFERASVIAKSFIPLGVDPGTIPLIAFPNPFSNSEPLQLQWNDISPGTPVDASLTDLKGRILWQKRSVNSGLTSLVLPDLSLPAGVYVMTLVAGDKKRTLKLVKQ